ncbi:hypothetical protein [Devosia sp.]|jgi:hypothetical protein|uniref:hypothetical protein n=1 Tax=Devosia sp. TaxID=1871048 RepID=UPI0035B2E8A5
MKPSKNRLGIGSDMLPSEEREERQIALEYVAEAWNSAEDDGISALALAHASLFAALTSLVEHHGEGPTADLVASLTDRVRSGEYNLTRSLQ